MPRHDIADLRELMRRLRDPDTGCPWDLAQDWKSLVRHTLEESYELADAVERDAATEVRDELGDYLFQAVFYAQIASERGLFDFDDVADAIVRKLLRRHPHVFPGGELSSVRAPGQVPDTADIRERWEGIKQEDRHARAQRGALDDVPLALPALARAEKLQRRAAREGFDWQHWEGVLDKLAEETAELVEAVKSGDVRAREDEMGDILFTCVNLARHLGVDAEGALRGASAKFERRFREMEVVVAARGESLAGREPEVLDALWREAKARLARDGSELV
jgi:ATP diphosphatase